MNLRNLNPRNLAPRNLNPRNLARVTIATAALAAATLVAPGAAAPPTADAPSTHPRGTVRIDTGWLRGEVAQAHTTYSAIPYAAPPVGERRWQPPAPPARWRGVRDATTPSPSCPQHGVEGVEGQEDCLYLDVTVPNDVRRGERLPVFVWLHGGGFTSGGAASFDGSRLATEGRMIVVTPNYRLGALGFLAHRKGIEGNYGLMDQTAALRWVERNAARFGGDRRNVTLAGQSAGARSVCAHLAAPTSRGLFDRAIIQSGACDNEVPTARAARAWGQRAVDDLGCADAADVAACLREAPVDRLLDVLAQEGVDHTQRVRDQPWNPVAGTAFLPHQPADAIRRGTAATVPLLVGSTRDEMRGFVSNEAPLTAAEYRTRLTDAFGGRASDVLAEYPVSDYDSPALALATVLSDWGGRIGSCPVLRTAQAARGHQPVYAYEFSEATDESVGGLVLGSFHGMDLPYLWDLDLPYDPYPGITTPAQQRLADTMIGYWSEFARSGAPNGRGRPAWPRFGVNDAVLELSSEGIAASPLADDHHCGFWDRFPQ